MRSFIGIDFDRETKKEIAAVQNMVRQYSVKGRFKYIGNFHLTLKFLGEIQNNMLPQIEKALKECTSHTNSFAMKVHDIGYFNGRGSIHALWLGLAAPGNALNELYNEISDKLFDIGIPKEAKAYVPHITIAQDLILKLPFEEMKSKLQIKAIEPIWINQIQLIKSEQINGKRVYTSMIRLPLKK